MKMSAPAPDWTAAVIRGCRSLALMVSSVTSAPRALEASGIWRFSSTSDSGTKSTQRTQCSLVPWANAGERGRRAGGQDPLDAAGGRGGGGLHECPAIDRLRLGIGHRLDPP